MYSTYEKYSKRFRNPPTVDHFETWQRHHITVATCSLIVAFQPPQTCFALLFGFKPHPSFEMAVDPPVVPHHLSAGVARRGRPVARPSRFCEDSDAALFVMAERKAKTSGYFWVKKWFRMSLLGKTSGIWILSVPKPWITSHSMP